MPASFLVTLRGNFEATLLAAIEVVLWICWQARTAARDIRREVNEALERGSLAALTSLSFENAKISNEES